MFWYQVIVSLAIDKPELTFPAGSNITKAITIGQDYLREHGGLESHFEVMTIAETPNDISECVYRSRCDFRFQAQYRLSKCEQSLRIKPYTSKAVELPEFLKKQAC
ncbi:MAG: hypothetical protein AAGB12_12470 [Pseudomonadota bacterium]